MPGMRCSSCTRHRRRVGQWARIRLARTQWPSAEIQRFGRSHALAIGKLRKIQLSLTRVRPARAHPPTQLEVK